MDSQLLLDGQVPAQATKEEGESGRLWRWAVVITLSIAVGICAGTLITRRARNESATGDMASMLTCDSNLGHRTWDGRRVVGNELCGVHGNIPQAEPIEGAEIAVIVIGDWGRDGFCCQKDVGIEINATRSAMRIDAVVNTGDNFYEGGLQNKDDDQFRTSWSDVYVTPFDLRMPWYGVLGNHDRYGDAQAQIDLSSEDSLWRMPDSQQIVSLASGGVDIDFFFFDTNALFYLEHKQLKWMNISKSEGDDQFRWLEQQLKDSDASWKVVVGHHPVYSSGLAEEEVPDMENFRSRVLPLLKENGVHAYFNGHAHSMEHMVHGDIHFFTSGAGSKLWPLSMRPHNSEFGVAIQGFMFATFSQDALRVEFIDYLGEVIYRTDVQRS